MKTLKTLTLVVLLAALGGSVSNTFGADKDEKAKAYPLDKCVVSDEKLGEMGKPYVFKHEGREVQLLGRVFLEILPQGFQERPGQVHQENRGSRGQGQKVV